MQKIRQVLDQNSWLRNASHIFLFLFFVLSRGQHKKKFFLSRGQTKKKKNSSALRGLVRTGGWEGRGWIATCCSRRGNLRKRRGARSEALTGARRRARRTHTGAFDRREVCCAGLAQEPRGTTENKFNPLHLADSTLEDSYLGRAKFAAGFGPTSSLQRE